GSASCTWTQAGASGSALANGPHVGGRAAGDADPADVLGEVAREGLDLDGERAHFLHARAVQVDAGAREFVGAHPAAAHAPDRGGQRADSVFRQSKNFADLADGGAAAIGDDGRSNAGMIAAVGLVKMLDYFLAPLVLEIKFDGGRLAAIRRDKPFEQ